MEISVNITSESHQVRNPYFGYKFTRDVKRVAEGVSRSFADRNEPALTNISIMFNDDYSSVRLTDTAGKEGIGFSKRDPRDDPDAILGTIVAFRRAVQSIVRTRG